MQCSGDQIHCEGRKVNSTKLPSYWEWVQGANFMGKREVKNEIMDIWEAYVSGQSHMYMI